MHKCWDPKDGELLVGFRCRNGEDLRESRKGETVQRASTAGFQPFFPLVTNPPFHQLELLSVCVHHTLGGVFVLQALQV